PSTQRPWNRGQGDIRAHPPGRTRARLGDAPRVVRWLRPGAWWRPPAGGGGGAGRPGQRGGVAWREDRAIAEQRIEDAGQAAGEGDHRDMLSTAGGDAEGPGPERLGLGGVGAGELRRRLG